MFLDSCILLSFLLIIFNITMIIGLIIKKKNINLLKIINISCLLINIILLSIYTISSDYLNVGLGIIIIWGLSGITLFLFVITMIILLCISKKYEKKNVNLISTIIIFIFPILIILVPFLIELKALNDSDYYIVCSDNDFFPNYYEYVVIDNKTFSVSLNGNKFIKNMKKVDFYYSNEITYYNGILEDEDAVVTDKEQEMVNNIYDKFLKEKTDVKDVYLSSYDKGEFIILEYNSKNAHYISIYHNGKFVTDIKSYYELDNIMYK